MMSNEEYNEIPQKLGREFDDRRKLASDMRERLQELESRVTEQSKEDQEFIQICRSINRFQRSLEFSLELYMDMIFYHFQSVASILRANQDVHKTNLEVIKTIAGILRDLGVEQSKLATLKQEVETMKNEQKPLFDVYNGIQEVVHARKHAIEVKDSNDHSRDEETEH